MTSKERLLIALNNGQADRVPVAPDMSNMIPCRMTGKPFWETYIVDNPMIEGGGRIRLGRAYLAAAKHFGFDGWDCGYVALEAGKDDKKEFERKIIHRDENQLVAREYYHTPESTLWQETIYYRDNPPSISQSLVKDFQKDFPLWLKYWFTDPSSMTDHNFQKWKLEMGDHGITSLSVPCPGLHLLVNVIDGGSMSNMEALTYAYYDYPEYPCL